MIPRNEYINKLKEFKDKNLIKVVTGMRRCGKSTLFELFIEYLKSIGVEDKRIIKINLEDLSYNFKDYKELYKYVNDRLVENDMNYVFLDEVQKIDKFQEAVDGLYIKKNVDLYITGSNSHILSGKLATLLSGRYVEIKILPLSFEEYRLAFVEEKSDERLFLDYMKNGGLPGNVEIIKTNPNNVLIYLDSILSTVVYNDIMDRKNISDKMILESILKYIFDTIGSNISTKKISDTLTSNHIAVSNHTVENYLNSFLESFLIYKAERFDVKGKKILARDYKYYVVDTGIRNFLLGKKANSDMGHILENIVYLELLRRGYKVYVGKVDEYEIDFVAMNNEGIEYYQVALTVRDEKTLNRELRALQNTNDYYPKTLITMDMDLEADYNGIKKVNVIDWLLKKK